MSDSSSDDECNIYLNAARKLKELKAKKKRQIRDEVNNESEDEVCRDDGPLVGAPKNEDVRLESLIKDSESSESEEDVSKEKEIEIECPKMDEDPVVLLDDDDSDDGNRRLTRLERKRKNARASMNKSTILNRLKVRECTADDSFENLLDDNLDDSLQLSQEDYENCVVIGSPPPTKKLNDDYEVSVKVLWMSSKMERFEIRRHETFQKIFMHFAKLEGVSEDQIHITKKGKRIMPMDTPISVDWSILDIFDGGVVSAEFAKKKSAGSGQDSEADTYRIKVQTSDKETLNATLKKTDTMEVLIRYCSEQLGVPESDIKLFFDGELVDLEETPETLDLDDDNCFDLKLPKSGR